MSSQTFSTFSEVGMIDARSQNGTITLPLTTDIPYRILTLKDIYGAAALSSITLVTQGTDVFEDGATSRILNGAFETTTLYAGQAGSWYVTGGSRLATAAIGTLSTGLIQNPLRLGTLSTQTAIQFPGLRTGYTGTVIAGQTTGVGTQELLLYQASSISDQIRLQTTGNIVFEAGASARSWPSTAALATPTLYIAGATSNIGVGTAAPATTLDVVGTGRFQTISTLSLNVSSINGAAPGTGTTFTGSTNYISAALVQTQVLSTFNMTAAFASFNSLSTNSFQSQFVSTLAVTVSSINGALPWQQLYTTSTIQGLGTIGYISSAQLVSTVAGLTITAANAFTGSTNSLSAGTIYVSSMNTNTDKVSTIIINDTVGAVASGTITQQNTILYFNGFVVGGTQAWYGDITVPPGPPLITTFVYSGVSQTWVVPNGVNSVNAYMWGAGGGGGVTVSGGAGAFVQAAVPVTPGETLTLVVGGGGGRSSSASAYGGGGVGGGGGFGTGGGGRTAIQRSSVGSNDYIVVGSGGGATNYGSGSAGIGGSGGISVGGAAAGTTGLEGQGGTQAAGGSGTSGVISVGASGSLAAGGNAGAYGGGGGAGYYGGGGSGATSGIAASGGGGSSLVNNVVPIALTVSSDGVAAPNTASQYYVSPIATGGTNPVGGVGGNGLIVLTYTAAPPAAPAGLTLTLNGATATLSWTSAGASLYYWAFYGNSTSAYSGVYLMSGSTTGTSVNYSMSITYFDYFRLVSLSPLGCISQIVSSPIINVPAPSGLSISASGTTVTLSWSAVSGATSYAYTLYSNTIYAYVGTLVTSGSVTGLTFTYNSGVAGTYYYFSVNATTSYGTSLTTTSAIVQDVGVLYTSSTVTVSTFPATSLASFGIGLAVNSSGNLLVATNSVYNSYYSYLDLLTYPSGTVTLLAGNGLGGIASGTGTSVPLGILQNIAFNASTSILYLTDEGNGAIRTYTPSTYTANSGTVATLSSSGFINPEGIALLQDGNFVVADRGANQIKVITPSGTVSVLAGSGASGLFNATGTSATFNWPTSVTVASDGKILVADRNNNVVRLVTYPGGVVTTFAGNSSGTSGSSDGTGTGASFYAPNGLGVLPNGNIILADRFNQTVRMMTYPGAVVTTIAGIQGSSGLVNGVGSSAKFSDPWSIAVSPYTGCIFVGDFYNGTVRLITPGTFSPPTGLTLTTSGGSATLSWTAAAGATGYSWNLYQSSTNSYNGTSFVTGTTNSTTYTATTSGLNLASYYYFTVIATGAANSAAAASAIVYELPSSPTGLAITATGTTVNMSWSASSGALYYNYTVYQGTSYAYSGTQVATADNGTSLSATYTGIVGNYYYFTVSVTTSAGTSALSTSGIAQAYSLATVTNYTSTTTVSATSYFYYKTVGTTSLTLTNPGLSFSVFCLAGGGGGGEQAGGGGGAGGLVQLSSNLSSGNYSITVGDGGAGGSGAVRPALGFNGSNSVLSNVTTSTLLATAIGGGGGGTNDAFSAFTGTVGGCGGGGCGQNTTTGSAGTSGQGYAGGSGSTYNSAGGGGGVGGVGGSASSTKSGNGGIGITYSDGNQYGGGGVGSHYGLTAGTTGYGGGAINTSGTSNTGGGGGADWSGGGTGRGGAGVVILSFTALLAPANLILITSGGSATLSWTAAAGATGYSWNLYQSSSNNYVGTSFATGTTLGATTASATGLTLGLYYYFTVIATATGGSSPAAASAIVLEQITGASALSLVLTTSNATLSWTGAGTSPTFYYTLFQNTSNSYTVGTIITVTSNSTASTSVTYSFSPNSNYYYFYSIYETTSSGTSATTQSPIAYFISYLIVAGGGGGGISIQPAGGGGGAGGLLTGMTTLMVGTTYSVAVGAGGTAGSGSNTVQTGGNGSNSTALGLTAIGGGGGGAAPNVGGSAASGNAGGSGGGASYWNFAGGTQAGGAGTSGQGYAGGSIYVNPTYAGARAGAGGGGAGGAAPGLGVNYPAANTGSANGGVGISLSITGTSTYYAGGGGGSTGDNQFTMTGGLGGGGNGTSAVFGISSNAFPGTPNTGGGGGGNCSGANANISAGAGGSGIVIFSVPTTSYSGTVSGTVGVSTITGYKILNFTGNGSYTA